MVINMEQYNQEKEEVPQREEVSLLAEVRFLTTKISELKHQLDNQNMEIQRLKKDLMKLRKSWTNFR